MLPLVLVGSFTWSVSGGGDGDLFLRTATDAKCQTELQIARGALENRIQNATQEHRMRIKAEAQESKAEEQRGAAVAAQQATEAKLQAALQGCQGGGVGAGVAGGAGGSPSPVEAALLQVACGSLPVYAAAAVAAALGVLMVAGCTSLVDGLNAVMGSAVAGFLLGSAAAWAASGTLVSGCWVDVAGGLAGGSLTGTSALVGYLVWALWTSLGVVRWATGWRSQCCATVPAVGMDVDGNLKGMPQAPWAAAPMRRRLLGSGEGSRAAERRPERRPDVPVVQATAYVAPPSEPEMPEVEDVQPISASAGARTAMLPRPTPNSGTGVFARLKRKVPNLRSPKGSSTDHSAARPPR